MLSCQLYKLLGLMFLWCRWRSLANCSVFAICVVASFAWGGEAFGPPAFQEVQGGCQTWALLHRRDREQNAIGGAAPGSVGERRVAGTLNQNNQKQAFWHHHVAWNTIHIGFLKQVSLAYAAASLYFCHLLSQGHCSLRVMCWQWCALTLWCYDQ